MLYFHNHTTEKLPAAIVMCVWVICESLHAFQIIHVLERDGKKKCCVNSGNNSQICENILSNRVHSRHYVKCKTQVHYATIYHKCHSQRS